MSNQQDFLDSCALQVFSIKNPSSPYGRSSNGTMKLSVFSRLTCQHCITTLVYLSALCSTLVRVYCNSSAARPRQTYKSLKLMLRLFCCIIFTVFSTAFDRRKKKWVIVGQHNGTSLGNIASVLLRRLVARCGGHVVNESSNMKLKKGITIWCGELRGSLNQKIRFPVLISTFNFSKIWKCMQRRQSYICHPKTLRKLFN